MWIELWAKLNQPLELDWRQNSFNFLRLALATSVIISHGFELGGFGNDPLFHFSHDIYSIGAVAVDGFFAISGALIVASFINRHSVLGYLWNRFLRIFPAYWLCILLCSIILRMLYGMPPYLKFVLDTSLLPAISVAQASAGFLLPMFLGWTPNLAVFLDKVHLFNSGSMPGVFIELAATGEFKESAVNGSLWSLCRELHLYFLVAILGITNLLTKKTVMFLFIANWIIYIVMIWKNPSWAGLANATVFRTAAHFLAGSLFFFSCRQSGIYGRWRPWRPAPPPCCWAFIPWSRPWLRSI